MKAMILQEGRLGLSEAQLLPLQEGWARLRLRSAGLCGTDIAKCSVPHLPDNHTHILGHEFVGVVHEMNGDYGEVKIGDTVVAMPLLPCGQCPNCVQGYTNICMMGRAIGRTEQGAFSAFVDVPVVNLNKISESNSDVFILADPLAVCIHASNLISEKSAPRRCLIIGDGTIACLQAWYQRSCGDDVWMLGKHDAPVSFIAQYGVKPFKAGEGNKDLFDVVFESVGRSQSQTLTVAINHVVPRGEIVVLGVFEQGYLLPMEVRKIFIKEVFLRGTNAYTRAEFDQACQMVNDHGNDLARFVTHWYPVSDLENALQVARSKVGLVLKIGLRNDLASEQQKE